MTIPLDLVVQFALGTIAGLFANRSVGTGGPFVNRVFMGLLASVAVFWVPPALVRFHFWNDWTWLYLIPPARFPAARQIPAEAAYVSAMFLAGIAGYRLAFRALSKANQVVLVALPWVAVVSLAAFLADRVFVFASFERWATGRAASIVETPWAFVMFSIELAAVIATVAVVRRLAESVSRPNPAFASARAR